MKVAGVIGRKVGMTRLPDGDGLVAVTLIKLEQQAVTKILTVDRDGYDAVQVGYYSKKEQRLSKADIARLRKVGIDNNYARYREFRTTEVSTDELGKSLTVELLKDVKTLDVQGITKGRGCQGVVKRWNHKTGRRTHGSRFHRRPGALGGRSQPGRVFKNKKMPGHMGAVNRTIQNLRVLGIDEQQQVVAVKGAIPGQRGGFVVVRPARKANVS